MLDDEKADKVVAAILRELEGRGGFDGWWGMIDEGTRNEILASLRVRAQEASA